MFRYIRSSNTYTPDILDIDIYIDKATCCVVDSAKDTILNYSDSAFRDFETNIYEFITAFGFTLESETHREDNSHYYIYEYNLKDRKLLLRVRLRLSDHYADDREIRGKSYNSERMSEHNLQDQTKTDAKAKYGERARYGSRVINIVFNGENFTSYDYAQIAIEDTIADFAEACFKKYGVDRP